MIVRDRWKKLTDKEKMFYVIKARLVEERRHFELIQDFYKERIETA